MPKNPDDIGALWLKTSQNGKRYFSGTVNGEAVVVFKNDHKQDGEKTPDYRVYKSKPRTDDRTPF